MPETATIISEKYTGWTNPRSQNMSLVPGKAPEFDKVGFVSGKRTVVGEDGQVRYLRTRREKGSRAFHVEYDAPPTRAEITRELTSYLAEYRLKIPKFSYELLFGRGREGDYVMRLRDIDRSEPIGNKTQRVIEERESWFEPTDREKAEDRGIEKLDTALRSIKTGDTVVWASPPGPKEQGYGDYGYLFVGKATKLTFGGAHLAMTAIRIENPKEEIRKDGEPEQDPWVVQCNKVLSVLTDKVVNHTTREQILGEPYVVRKNISIDNVDSVIKKHFDPFDPEAQAQSEAIIAEMAPLIDDASLRMLFGTKEEKLKTLHALENYAIKLKSETTTTFGENTIYMRIKKPQNIGNIIDKFGNSAPPRVGGSCGNSDNPTAKAGETINGVAGGECPSIKCRGKKEDGTDCTWEASPSEAKAVQERSLTACPECGWTP